jgi:NAD(P)-dependent dehydrogenase (short-subunit alcohol dehydrogenase family)
MSFENKGALVTEASSGIGKACAGALVQNAATVVAADLNVESSRASATQINAAGGVAQAGVQIR